MEKFSYKVKDSRGKPFSGTIEAGDERQAAKVLQKEGFLVISLTPKKESPFKGLKGHFFGRIGANDKVNFTRQLATMINAGLSVTNALSLLEAQAKPAMGRVIGEILREIEGGGSLSRALEKHPAIFDQVYIALVRAGEAAGILDKVLTRLADNLEKRREFTGKVKGAMLYPAIIVVGMVVVATIVIIFVIPKLTSLFEEFQAELPLATRILLAISRFAVRFWPLVFLVSAGGVFGLRMALKNSLIKREYENFLFKIPVIGNLRKKIMLTEFTRTLGLLVGAGVLIVDALVIVRRSLGSEVYEEAVVRASEEVERGFPLAAALARAELFPPIVPQMVAVGEETGKLDEVLGKISSYFEQESSQLLANLTSAMEPFIMIILGVGVGFLVVSVIMPIYSLTSQF